MTASPATPRPPSSVPSSSAAGDGTRPGQDLFLVGAMQTHPGSAGIPNEDAVAYVLPRPDEPFARSGALALVADGMGGHAAGEVASRIAADIIRRRYYEVAGSVPEALAAGFEAANRAIYERNASSAEFAGMGTTCTVFAVRDGMIYLGHIGDSRAYLLRDGRFEQLSQDHSVVAELVRRGSITAAEASRSPYRNLVLRALGLKPTVEPLIWPDGMPLRPGDAIVLCSDGLSNRLEDAAIAEVVGRLPPPEACQTLIAAALARGASDNISLGVFTVGTAESSVPDTAGVTRIVDAARLTGAPK